VVSVPEFAAPVLYVPVSSLPYHHADDGLIDRRCVRCQRDWLGVPAATHAPGTLMSSSKTVVPACVLSTTMFESADSFPPLSRILRAK
jgi:hypothetical protein